MANKTSASQYETMLEYMERNGDLLKPESSAQGRVRSLGNWEELRALLNQDASGSVKSVEKWKKVWTDLKSRSKKKAADIIQASRMTGGGPNTSKPLSPLEERVVAVMGERSITGSDVAERGFPNLQVEYLDADADLVFQNQLSTSGSAADITESVFSVTANVSDMNKVDHNHVEMQVEYEQQQPVQQEQGPATRQGPRGTQRVVRRVQTTRTRTGPFDRAAQLFSQCEEQRLQLERTRLEDLKKRDDEWLQLERIRLEHRLERDARWLALEELRSSNEARHLSIYENVLPAIVTALADLTKALNDRK